MDSTLIDKLPVKSACYYCHGYNISVKDRCKFCDYGRVYTDSYAKYRLGELEPEEVEKHEG